MSARACVSLRAAMCVYVWRPESMLAVLLRYTASATLTGSEAPGPVFPTPLLGPAVI